MVTRRLMALESLEATVEVQLRSYLEARVDQSRGNGHQRQGMIGMLWLLNTPKKMPNWGEISPATAEKYHLNILKWCLLSQLQLLRALTVEKSITVFRVINKKHRSAAQRPGPRQ